MHSTCNINQKIQKKSRYKYSLILIVIFITLIILFLVSCGNINIIESNNDFRDTIIEIKDKNLEEGIRLSIRKLEGPIYISDAKKVTELILNKRIPRAYDSFITDNSNHIIDLNGIEYFTSLQKLNLEGNSITDISKIEALENLKELNISFNNIENIGSLKDLINLEILNISYNGISDINALENLNGLKELYIGNSSVLAPIGYNSNTVCDISVLKDMEKLTVLDLQGINISDITVLEKLTSIKDIKLYHDEILDKALLINKEVPQELKAIEIDYSKAITPKGGVKLEEAKKLIASHLKEIRKKDKIDYNIEVTEITVNEAYQNNKIQIFNVQDSIAVIKNNEVLCVLDGMPTWKVFLADLDGDRVYEVYTNVSFGSGIVSTDIRGYNINKNQIYSLSYRMNKDLELFIMEDDSSLYVKEYDYNSGFILNRENIQQYKDIKKLAVVDGQICLK